VKNIGVPRNLAVSMASHTDKLHKDQLVSQFNFFKWLIAITLLIVIMDSCKVPVAKPGMLVSNADELKDAIKTLKPGSELIMANGTWNDLQIKFFGKGTKEKPITLRAESPGKVFLEGQSFLHLGGEYLVVDGLHFRNGFSPHGGIIRYQIGKDSTAFNSRITNCVVQDYSQLNRSDRDTWIEFYGRHNQLDHCYISGKANDGATLMVYHNGNKHTNNHHQIVYNYFGPRPRKGGPRAETMRLGGSETSMTPGYVNVSHNYFEGCNGEVEIISDKTNYNTFTNNIFYKCEGSLVMRHSNYTTVDKNIFIGDDDSDFYGGIRAVNTGHWITNNYFYKIKGKEFRSPLAMMNGIPKSPINRYKQVTDVVVAHNTWVDCKSPWQIGVGQNKASKDVLPLSEIRSAPPIRCIIANNLIYNTQEDQRVVVNHDDIDGVLFRNNILDNNGKKYVEYNVLRNEKVNMVKSAPWLYVPANGQGEIMDSIYNGFDFDKIQFDLFGESRANKNSVGAISTLTTAERFKIDKSKYGPDWFNVTKSENQPKTLTVSAAEGELQNVIEKAESGDIIELIDDKYLIANSLKISKEITIRSNGENKVQLLFSGEKGRPAFEMNPKGTIRLENISIIGQNNNLAFAPLDKGMSSAYNLFLDKCVIENFAYVLKASKGSFADSIGMRNTIIQNCENGIVLAADEKGDYNAEMLTFDNCEFVNIQRNVINFYRGGYDESTIGGFLTLMNNTFSECGKKETKGLLIKTPGIINVLIANNTFKNNPVKMSALIWGAKNNHEQKNTIINSGRIEIEEQQKLEIIY